MLHASYHRMTMMLLITVSYDTDNKAFHLHYTQLQKRNKWEQVLQIQVCANKEPACLYVLLSYEKQLHET